MKKKIILLAITVFISLTVSSLNLIRAEQTIGVDEKIIVQKYSDGFGTYLDVGSFNASPGNYVGVYLFTSSSSTNYSEIEVQVVGQNSGTAFDVRATNFNQVFQINSDDTYKITIIKQSPFYDDLTVSGEIIVHHYPMVITTNQPSPSPTLTQTPSPSPIPTSTNSASPIPLLSPSPTIQLSNQKPELLTTNFIIIVSAMLTAVISASLLVFFKIRNK